MVNESRFGDCVLTIETARYRYKTIVGRRLHARTLPNQRTEAKIGSNMLNRMTGLGMPASARVS
jgi:hypothetical protein